jgi:RNA polymerase sigma-70 factor (ECF subfamily)
VTGSCDSIERSISSITSAWLEEARQGVQEAWSRLHRAYRPLVCWWCARGGIPAQDIDDVAQDVFAALARSLASFEHQTFRGYLWTVTRNKIRDYWRGRQTGPAAWGGNTLEQVLDHVEADSNRSVGSADQATKILFDAVVQMVRGEFSEQNWNAFWQVAVEGKPAADVAEALGMTRNMVYLARTRIMRRIREEFGGAG